MTFEDWCIKNNRQDILARWDTKLNKLNPNEISYGVANKYWFKCPKNSDHESELKGINKFTSGASKNMDCKQCTRIINTHPESVQYFVNKEDAITYSKGCNKKTLVKCPICGHEKLKNINDLIYKGIGCIICGDGTSYSEKFFADILQQANIDFITQLSKKNFEWCDKYKYDFYIPSLNTIIETHGEQHYEKTRRKGGRDLKEEQENDRFKKILAMANNIDNYLIIDCRKSDLTFIKNNLIKSDIFKILNFNTECIDWNRAHLAGLSNKVKKTCDLYNGGLSITKISLFLKIDSCTVRNYLKKGNEIGLCNYIPRYHKQIRCKNTGEIFNSTREVERKYNINHSSITTYCNGEVKNQKNFEFEFV